MRISSLFSLSLLCLILSCQKAPEERQPLPWVEPPVEAPSTVQVIMYSPHVGDSVSFHVYIPDVYNEDTARAFPVLYWLHGGGGGREGIPSLVQFFGSAMSQALMPEALIVFPNGLPFGMWCDSKDGRQPIEQMVIRDLIPWVDAHYRTITGRRGRIVEGFSMGGYGAARFGIKYPDLFGGFSMLAAGPLQLDFSQVAPQNEARQPAIFREVYGEDMAYFEAQSPWRLAEIHGSSLPDPTPKRLLVGKQDFVYLNNLAFRQHLQQLGIPHQFRDFDQIGHAVPPLFMAMGQSNWIFYKTVWE
jgi:enterochelin esterase-like enzyme